MTQFFKSALDQAISPVVICDLQHTILYMNPVADDKLKFLLEMSYDLTRGRKK